MPHAGELPRPLGAVVPLVGAGVTVIAELVAHRLPGHAAVVRSLNHLPEPPARLRSIEPLRISRRPGNVVDLPAGEVRAADIPALPAAVRRQNERALARPDEYPNATHARSHPRVCHQP